MGGGELAPGWYAAQAEDGQAYYVHASSGETSWDRPVAASPRPTLASSRNLGSPANVSLRAALLSSAGASTRLPAASASRRNNLAASALPPGWVETTDPDSGGVYYFHSLTGETSWERPADRLSSTPGAVASPRARAASASRRNLGLASPLPAGWQEAVDDAGAVYYYNEATDETSWDRPVAASPAGPRGSSRILR